MTQVIFDFGAFNHHGLERDVPENILCSLGCFLKSHPTFSMLIGGLVLEGSIRQNPQYLLSMKSGPRFSHLIFCYKFFSIVVIPKVITATLSLVNIVFQVTMTI